MTVRVLRRSVLAPAAFVVAGLVTVATPIASQAFAEKELTACYLDTAPVLLGELKLVVNGPVYRTLDLLPGQCLDLELPAGRYQVTFGDPDALPSAVRSGVCLGATPAIDVAVARGGETNTLFDQAMSAGGFTADLKKDQNTSISFLVRCST